ncbi:MAG TPA: DUF4198 domain-containing protein [Candidatus Methylomirabilis sp.]|nr:DUF4198 domain-containing protein [Candidatus Methylomirabilis sp.]
MSGTVCDMLARELVARAAALLALLVLLAPGPGLAHDGWIEAHPAIVESGQSVSLFLLYGNHSNEHRSYRLASKWEPKYARLVVVDPAGRERDLSAQIVDLGEDAEAVGPKGPKGFHLAAFAPADPGLYLALVKQVRVVEFGGPRFQSIVVAKTAFVSLASPTVLAAQGAVGFDRPIGGDDALEIIPISNPAGLRTGDPLSLEVRYRGRPAAGRVVSVVGRLDGAASARDLTTDAAGRVKLVAGPADYYLARVSLEDQTERVEGRFDKSAYEATYVFPVFRRP